MPVSAVRKRLPKEWPTSPPPLGNRYGKRRASRSSSSASATMQLRMSPGGSTPNSRRRRPEEPPSSVTVTTPVSWRSRGPPTWCFKPRSSADSPVPPPIATRARARGASTRCSTASTDAPLPLLELDQDLLGHRLQGVEDPDAGGGDRLEGRLALVVEGAIQL